MKSSSRGQFELVCLACGGCTISAASPAAEIVVGPMCGTIGLEVVAGSAFSCSTGRWRPRKWSGCRATCAAYGGKRVVSTTDINEIQIGSSKVITS